MTLKLAEAARNAASDAVVDLLDLGHLIIYDGTEPATPETGITTQNVLADITLPATAFGAAGATNPGEAEKAGTWTVAATGTGTATFYRLTTSASGVIAQGSVGTSGEDLNLSATAITTGGDVTISTFVHTQPM